MVRFQKQLRKCRRAVSDIIGNLLILAITVTLFSSIMFYVATIPSPEEQTYAEIDYELSEVVDGARWISLTHKGGQPLDNQSTNIYLFTYGTNLISLKMNSSSNPLGTTWTPGEVWKYKIEGINTDTPLSVVIIDTVHNSKVWEAEMIGGQVTGSYAPIITSRGTKPSIIIDGSSFRFSAAVMDPDGNLNTSSVMVDARSIGLNFVQLTDPDNDGVFTSDPIVGKIAYDDKLVMVMAKDMTDKSASSRFTLVAQYAGGGGSQTNNTQIGPFYDYESYLVNGTYPPDASGGQSGGPVGTTFYYIRRASDNNISRSFTPGEKFYIEIYSDKLVNLAIENSFSLYNPTTGALLAPPSKLINAFSYGGIYATFHRYYINLSAPMQPLYFPLQISLRDNTGTVVNIPDSISVTGAQYPIIKTYKVNSANQLELCKSFNHTDIMYLKIFTKDVDSNITRVVINDIQVNDYTGKYVIKQTLPTPTTWMSGAAPTLTKNAPLSQIYKTSKTGTSPSRIYDSVVIDAVYTVQIKLLEPNNDWWLAGRNSYSMLIPVLTDSGNYGTGETYYNLNYQFNVTAPRSTTDMVASVGAGSFTWSASGATWEDNKLVWYKNGERFDQWDATYIDQDTYNGPTGMVLADIDNDGYQDVVVGYQDSTVSLAWYRNQNFAGSAWSTLPYIICTAFDAYPGTQAAENNDKGLANEDSSVWATSYSNDRFAASSYSAINEVVGALGSGDFDGDGDTDIVASFLHAVVYTSATGSGDASYANSFGMFFNRGIYVFWNDGSWTKTQLSGTNTYTNQNDNPGAMDIAVDDLNQDGVDDIVAVYETGVTKIWINQWRQVIGITTNPKAGSFGPGAVIPAANIPTVESTNPWDHTQRTPSVAISDVDLNGYPDIIRTSTAAPDSDTKVKVTVIKTMPSTPSDTLKTPSAEYSLENETSAKRTGTMANLVFNDNVYETLTETYKNTSMLFGLADQKQASSPNPDNTGQDINNLKYDDGVTYNVDSGTTMHVRSFAMDSTYSTKPITQVILRVQYSATAGYNGNNYIKYSLNGTTFFNTNMLPTSSSLDVNQTFDLKAAGIDTWSELQSLRVMFVHNGTSDTVQFDYVRLELKYAESRWMEWVYEVPNLATQVTHQMGISAYTTGEKFNVQYSTDRNIWYDAFNFTETTETLKQLQLPHTTNAVYYIKVSAADRSLTDVFNDSLVLDIVGIRHISPTVNWPAKLSILFKMQNNNEFITALAVGDVTSATDMPDNYPDIIVGTSYLGSGATDRSLMYSYGVGGNSFSPALSITTSSLSAAVGGNNPIYNVQTLALGDFNGDGYTDIALVIGFAPGRSGGTAPSIWLYRNDPTVHQWGEQVLNALASGESAINVKAGNVDLTILYPLLGVLGLVAAEGWINRKDRKRR
ncbi:MAG TPA: type IV pilin [Methanomassiliicoccales archaeon]|nr:type IV pilin [Methanomassiliicoccales archaeon]